MAYHGILIVNKEKGFTSHDVVAKLRGILKQKRIGHTGTLDPDAEGVLPVCLGAATKLCDLLTEKRKTYVAVLQLGIITDTQDLTGKVIERRQIQVTKEEIENAVFSFLGEYDQIPPMYSALKINGKKLYELAREGKEVTRSARKVVIHDIAIQNIDLKKAQIMIEVECSKGTYIRTLCQDIGETLGCGGCMAQLTRTKVDVFSLENSITLHDVEACMKKGNLENYIIPIDSMFSSYPKLIVKEEYDKYLYNGNCLKSSYFNKYEIRQNEDQKYKVYDSHKNFKAIYEWCEELSQLKPIKMFLS